ncbi:hypothetical protein ACFRCG_12535 [Embleya sp. NPDC056575]|uniref:hypothetical protein n=1 Tax=unclassified Embleya TaxID=2699296 RepID=UPI00369F0BF7
MTEAAAVDQARAGDELATTGRRPGDRRPLSAASKVHLARLVVEHRTQGLTTDSWVLDELNRRYP